MSSLNAMFNEANQCKIKSKLDQGNAWFNRADGSPFEYKSYTIGSKDSNNWQLTVYDKIREVIEANYKGFFYKMWRDNGLISYYDEWCMKYAYVNKSYNALHKARLAFYINHGANPDRKTIYVKALKNDNTTLAEIKALADEFMPPITCIVDLS